jgi:hypothetical protein
VDKYYKYASEKWRIWGDFAKALTGNAETISTATVAVVDRDGAVVSSTILDISTLQIADTRVIVIVRAGSTGASPYKVTFKTVSSLGYKYEIDVRLVITNIKYDADFTKQSYESFPVGVPLSRNMEGSEIISSVTVTAVDRNSLDSSSIVIDQTNITKENQIILALIRDGEQSLSPYRILYTGETSIGEIFQKGIVLKIKEK